MYLSRSAASLVVETALANCLLSLCIFMGVIVWCRDCCIVGKMILKWLVCLWWCIFAGSFLIVCADESSDDKDSDDSSSLGNGEIFLTPPYSLDELSNISSTIDGVSGNSSSRFVPILSEGALLMDVPKRVSNWNRVTSNIQGWYGWDYPASFPCGGSRAWTGVLCKGPIVVELRLKNLGLQGFLSVDIMKLPNIETIDFSNNQFEGYLPPQWSSRTLKKLILSNNKLTGELPAAYGAMQTFPSMIRMSLDGNDLTGRLPGSEWLSIGFARQAVITLRPGNEDLCGEVPVVDPKYYATMPDGEKFVNIEGPSMTFPDSAFSLNTSQVYLVYKNLFAMTPHLPYSSRDDISEGAVPKQRKAASFTGNKYEDPQVSKNGVSYTNPTNIVITNTLGTCSIPCGQTASLPSGNLLEAAWRFNVTLRDILRYNNGLDASNAEEGKGIALPCYQDGLVPRRSSSNAALGMFAGGNQRTVVGTVGAEIAGAVVRGDGLEVVEDGIYFEGIMDWEFDGDGMKAVMVEPVYWFVDLGATYTVTGISIRSGDAMTNISAYVGDDLENIFGNTIVADQESFGSGETKILPVNYVKGNMVVLYASASPKMSLSNVKVWTAEGNMATEKTIMASANLLFGNSTNSEKDVIVDGDPGTCVDMDASQSGQSSIAIDSGAEVMVDTVIVLLKDTISQSDLKKASMSIFVSDSRDVDSSDVKICGRVTLGPGQNRLAAECHQQGRYVGLILDDFKFARLCEIDMYVTGEDIGTQSYITVSSQSAAAIIVGSVLGGAALALLLGIAALWWRKRSKARKIAANKDIYQDAEKGMTVYTEKKDSMTSQSGGSLSPRKLASLDPYDIGSSSREQSTSLKGSPIKAGRIDSVTNRSTDTLNLSASLSATVDIISFSDIELVRTIGEGSYGLVWLGRYLQTSVAVKVLTHDTKKSVGWRPDQPPSEAALLALQKEASIMASLRHPNCVQYLGCCLDPPSLVMEYCSRRSVDKILADALQDERASRQLDWVHLLGIATDAAKGMLYLHTRSPPIVHRDLKSPNLLVDALWHVKISDFNLSRALEQDSFSTSLQITNPRWLAPEILRGEHGGKAADVYSFGIVLWELMTWRLPWGNESNPFSIINSVLQGKQLEIPGQADLPAGHLRCYERYVALIQQCWLYDTSKRPAMDYLVSELRNMLSDLIVDRINASGQNGSLAASSSETDSV